MKKLLSFCLVFAATLTTTAFGASCPQERINAELTCAVGGKNQLKFVKHSGQYLLDRELHDQDMSGRATLRCTFSSTQWTSTYQVGSERTQVSRSDELARVLENITDLRNKSEVALPAPELTVWYFKRILKRPLFHAATLDTGLGIFMNAGAEKLDERKVGFIFEKAAFQAHLGGVYNLGTSCILSFKETQ